MNATSNCDVTDSAHQIQMTTISHWMNTPPLVKIFCARHCLQESWSMVQRTYQMTDMEINPWPKRF